LAIVTDESVAAPVAVVLPASAAPPVVPFDADVFVLFDPLVAEPPPRVELALTDAPLLAVVLPASALSPPPEHATIPAAAAQAAIPAPHALIDMTLGVAPRVPMRNVARAPDAHRSAAVSPRPRQIRDGSRQCFVSPQKRSGGATPGRTAAAGIVCPARGVDQF
jgi:hypothetical protein